MRNENQIYKSLCNKSDDQLRRVIATSSDETEAEIARDILDQRCR